MRTFLLFTVASGNVMHCMLNIFMATTTLEDKPYAYAGSFMLLGGAIIINVLFATITFYYQDELMKSKIGKPILGAIAAYFLFRSFSENILFKGFNGSILAWVFLVFYTTIGVSAAILFFLNKPEKKQEKDDYLFMK